jgi:hypothetical protein
MTDSDGLDLQTGMRASGMDYQELWLRYIAVSGEAGELELEAYVLGLLTLDAFQYNLIAQALNEYFIEQGQDHPVAYWDEVSRR